MKRFVYADNAATTKISPQVFDAMVPYLTEQYGNPSSIYSIRRGARKAIEVARQEWRRPSVRSRFEVSFTGCGTESDNWALKSTAEVMKQKGKNQIITTNFEHHAILHTCEHPKKHGFEIVYLPVSAGGICYRRAGEKRHY